MTPTGHQSLDGGLVRRVEVLLSSLAGVVSARVILDQKKGAQVHIIATTEMPVSEISRAAMSALSWGLGCAVPSDNITVVQSRLSREELNTLLGLEPAEPPFTPIVPEPPPTSPPDSKPTVSDTGLSEFIVGEAQAENVAVTQPENVAVTQPENVAVTQAQNVAVAQAEKMGESEEESRTPSGSEPAEPPPTPVEPGLPPTGPPDPKPPVPGDGLLDFSVGNARGKKMGGSEELPRLKLQDLQVNRNSEGAFSILVRLTDDDRSIGAEREGVGTTEDSLEVPAIAALGVIQEFLRADREDDPSVTLRFTAARRLRHTEHDVVVVLVEAEVHGRRIPLTGAASATEGIEKASILATLQATNGFVASNGTAAIGNGALPQ